MAAAREPRSRAALAGAAIIAAIVALAIFIFSLDEIVRSRRATIQLVGVFPDAAGARPGTPVWLGGKEVGEVLSVSFLEPRPGRHGAVALLLELPGEVAAQVRRDSEIRLGPPRLLALPVVRISPGSPGAPPLRPGDTLRAEPEEPFEPLRARAPVLKEQVEALAIELRGLAGAAQGRAARLDAVERRLDAVAVQARRVDLLLAEGPLAQALDEEGLRADVRRLLASVDTLRTGFGRLPPLGADSAAWRASAGSLALQFRDLRAEQARLDSLLTGPYGTLGRLRADSALVWAVADTRAALDSLFAELRAAPHRLFF